MLKLKLPTVTLLGCETRAHELAARTINDALTKIEPAEVIVWTNDPKRLAIPGAHYFHMDDIKGSREFWGFVSCKALASGSAPHVLFMEWDTGLMRPELWDDKFLQYDYIGAPWWYKDNLNVGNGGFSLRSKRLANFAARDGRVQSDNNLCRDYRREFERAGDFKWAPDDLARVFSREGRDEPDAFGFHDARNWYRELSREEIIIRFRLMIDNLCEGPHLHWEMLLKQMPWLADEVRLPDSCKNWKML